MIELFILIILEMYSPTHAHENRQTYTMEDFSTLKIFIQ